VPVISIEDPPVRGEAGASTEADAEWPARDLEHLGRCPVCASAERELRHEALTDLVYRRAPGRWQLFQCAGCGAAYLDPRPTQATIGRAYAEFFTHPPAMVDDASPSLSKRLKRALRNGYINGRLHTHFKPATRLGSMVIPVFPGKKREIDFSLRSLPPLAGLASRKLLDVGSGNGDFLKTASDIGWDAMGVESDATAARQAQSRGLRATSGRFEDIELPERAFDVITLSHVVEHLHDPVGMLRKALQLLKPGGQIWIATPNLDGAGHARFRSNWIGLDSPRHLVLFNRASLMDTLARAGFVGTHRFLPGRSAAGHFLLSWKAASGLKPFEAHPARLPIALRLEALRVDAARSLEDELVVAARTAA
jgi:2-polyprenyl-3-methyl-5-hydroxy-6-metoxy-1,4-benzoquinol methylase